MDTINIEPINIEPNEGELSAYAIGVTQIGDCFEFVVLAKSLEDGSQSVRRAPLVKPYRAHGRINVPPYPGKRAA